jgi:hypothetical protein
MISQNDGVKLTTPTLPREEAKMSHTHVTAPTQFVEVKGIRFAYRQFRKQSGVALVFMQHFRGGLDH